MTLQKILSENHAEARADLVGQIMHRIELYEYRRNLARLITHSVLSLATGVALIPAISYMQNSLSESGFSSYLSLIISDGTHVFSYISDLILSLASSWPLPASILVLGVTVVFINSIRNITRYTKYLSINREFPIS